jgi:two-component system, OmpR family, KDP operon response regulator KdpE
VDEVDYLRVDIRRLRDKLGDDADEPRYIRTERGLGYRFIAPH